MIADMICLVSHVALHKTLKRYSYDYAEFMSTCYCLHLAKGGTCKFIRYFICTAVLRLHLDFWDSIIFGWGGDSSKL